MAEGVGAFEVLGWPDCVVIINAVSIVFLLAGLEYFVLKSLLLGVYNSELGNLLADEGSLIFRVYHALVENQHLS